ncbi:MAG: isoprenylcysteine carboxylmethyltransferase family protein [Verrucomicrobia bacterium]|jgi:protein-S-isoprenylcysteine O-methyltransferase Ste14|nr:isoprenylcysteine carboxylmethyltransferase family protein [Verrucomicrobiota bacterium]
MTTDGMEQWIPFAWVYWLCFICASTIRALHRRRFHQPLPKLDPKELPGMLLSFLGMTVFPLIYTLTDWLAFADYKGTLAMEVSGTLGMILSVAIISKSHRDLGAQWTHTPRQVDHPELVVHGIYTTIRHPMYAAHFLWGISQALLLWNVLAGFGFLIGFLVFLPLRLSLEESNLKQTFGESYSEYAAKTPRFIPRGKRSN